jgi:hypothetical protein
MIFWFLVPGHNAQIRFLMAQIEIVTRWLSDAPRRFHDSARIPAA